jgi:hypothetical protein
MLPLFTIMSTNNCGEDVMTACGIYLLAEEEKRVKRKYWIYNVF